MKSTWMSRVMVAGLGLALSAGLAMAAPTQGQGPERPNVRRQGPPPQQAQQERPGPQQMAPGERGMPGMPGMPGMMPGPMAGPMGQGQWMQGPGMGGMMMQWLGRGGRGEQRLMRMQQRMQQMQQRMQQMRRESGAGWPGLRGLEPRGPAFGPQFGRGERNLGLFGREREREQGYAGRQAVRGRQMERRRMEVLGVPFERGPMGPPQMGPMGGPWMQGQGPQPGMGMGQPQPPVQPQGMRGAPRPGAPAGRQAPRVRQPQANPQPTPQQQPQQRPPRPAPRQTQQ